MNSGNRPDVIADVDNIAALIGKFTGIGQTVLSQLINTFGIETVLNNPDSIGLEPEQAEALKDISQIIHYLGDQYYVSTQN
jgi:hypothetical protein